MDVHFSIYSEETDNFFTNKQEFAEKICYLNYANDKKFYFIPKYRKLHGMSNLIFHFNSLIYKKFFSENTTFNYCEISKVQFSPVEFVFIENKLNFSSDQVYFDNYENSRGTLIFSEKPNDFYLVDKNTKIYKTDGENKKSLLKIIRLMHYRKNNYKILEKHKIHAIEIINIFCINIHISYEFINKIFEIFECRVYKAIFDQVGKKYYLEKYNWLIKESVNNFARIILVEEHHASYFPYKTYTNHNTFIFVLSKLPVNNHHINYKIKLDIPEKYERETYINRLIENLNLCPLLKDDLLKKSGGKSFTEINYSINYLLANGCDEDNSDNCKKINLEDLSGYETEKEELKKSFIFPIQYRDIFRELEMKETRGILLYGPPGCGKTSLARAVANEMKINFFLIKAAELVNKYVGVTERNIRELFEKARVERPTLLFFDEIDTIASMSDRSYNNSICNTLLTEIDSIDDNSDIYIIATTNNKDRIIKPLLRPGRFDKHIKVNLPNLSTRKEIFKTSLLTFSNEQITKFANFTDKFSCAHIHQVIQEAKEMVFIEKIKNRDVFLTEKHILNGIFKVKKLLI